MPSRLQSLCDAIIEATWLVALVAVPLFFNVYSQRVFEPDKISVLRSLALIALAAWIVKKVDGWRAGATAGDGAQELPLWRRPLVLPVLILAAAYLLSTAFSVAPRQSFWGGYQRLQGAYTLFAYVALFFVVVDTLRTRAQWQRLQYAIILASVPVALYGFLQRLQLDPLLWGGETTERIAANMGNAIFVAAYLIMAVPLTVERLIAVGQRILLDEEGNSADALAGGALLFVLIIQLVAILFTQSRGPWLGLAAGAYVFLLLGLTDLRRRSGQGKALSAGEIGTGIGVGLAGMVLLGVGIWLFATWGGVAGLAGLAVAGLAVLAAYLAPLLRRTGWRWLWLTLVTQALVAFALLILLNLPNTPLEGLKQAPYVGRLGQVLETESGTGRVRVLIWQGAIELMLPHEPLEYPDGRRDPFNAIRPLIGYGPETMWVTFNRFYDPELGGLERRNASPDRSHNETFDSLVITGVVGFLAYILLFTSVFYFALRWLGLIQHNRDRTVFILLGASGGLLGVIVPVLLGAAYYAGVGIAIGFILGVIVFVTYAAFRGGEGGQALDRRQIVIIALLATVVAHFIEIHFGIAIVATRTYFFVLIAALVAVGTQQVSLTAEPAAAPEQPSASKHRNRGRGRRSPETAAAQPAFRLAQAEVWRGILPYALIAAAAMLVIVWNYLTNQAGRTDALTVFWRSWVTHLQDERVVDGPGALWIVVFTLFVGFILALGETWPASAQASGRSRPGAGRLPVAAAIFAGVSLGAWLLFGLVQAQRLVPQSTALPLATRADHVAGHITSFYVWLGCLLLLLAGAIWYQEKQTWRLWRSCHSCPASALSAVALAAAAGLLISQVNLNLVRADIYFKLGQSTDARGDYRTSLLFYEQATRLAPREDHYQLFRGRALLEAARAESDATVQTALLDRAEQVLNTARQLNPLNTDHTANLARYYATRAATLSDPAAQEAALRQSLSHYQQATSLSPNAAHLQNEWATIYAQLGEFDQARERLARSLELDRSFADTYLRLAQIESQLQQWEAALAAYDRVAELRPDDVRGHSGRGYVLAQLGRSEEAIAANLDVLSLQPNEFSALQNLMILYQQAGDLPSALIYAQRAAAAAPERQRANIEAFVQQLEQQLGGG